MEKENPKIYFDEKDAVYGSYANHIAVTQTETGEIVIDFAIIPPNSNQGKGVARIFLQSGTFFNLINAALPLLPQKIDAKSPDALAASAEPLPTPDPLP